MCGGSIWEYDEWRPFRDFLSDLDRPLTREPRPSRPSQPSQPS
jgi:hypothetical protein